MAEGGPCQDQRMANGMDATAQVAQLVLGQAAQADGASISALDTSLHSQLQNPAVDWAGLHGEALRRDPGVAPVGPPYWAHGRPLSVLAFLGVSARDRIAADPRSPEALLSIMAGDPDPTVARRIAARSQPAAAPVPGPPPAQPFATPPPADRGPATSRRAWLPALIGSAITAVVLVALVAALASLGLGNAYSYTVTDQAARAETSHEEWTGTFTIVDTNKRICGNGKDYLSCVNQHVAVYNTACLNLKLTSDAASTCRQLKNFITQTKARYKSCGYGCKTRAGSNGLWGWAYLRAMPITEQVSNGDAAPAVSHTEYCTFALGPIKLGSCPK